MSSEKQKLIDKIWLKIFEDVDGDYYSSDIDTLSLEKLSKIGLNSMNIIELQKFLERLINNGKL